jgi:deoxyribodipyrimidine photo-lyase
MSLAADLKKAGRRLVLRRGDVKTELSGLIARTGAQTVTTTRCYEPWAGTLEIEVKALAEKHGATFHRFAGNLLFEPESVRTQAGEPFRVFTPFYRAATAR